ncbi:MULTISPECIES: hypothetical protein [Roseomonadaceae]|uniref:Uncharacterized protein n=1 Tax=Falsiroseomonas oleicola TaxID=2801474 RepID=A0ABS6HDB8_9PROT|nr:hypothetical protein [Roseomonas oleicola]MBU8546707.1 hypothetical protein [Roseomonas oleicola]
MPARPVLVPEGAPCLEDFLSGRPDDRLRDLLAFALAVEAGPPMDRAALQARAEAELEALAFRRLHNQVETIRLEAAREQILRLRGPGLPRLILGNLIALGLVAGVVAVLRQQGLLAAWGL